MVCVCNHDAQDYWRDMERAVVLLLPLPVLWFMAVPRGNSALIFRGFQDVPDPLIDFREAWLAV